MFNRTRKVVSISESDGNDLAVLYYKILCPPLIIACIISVALNMGLFFVGTFGTNHKSPVLVLSLNLATTDTIASLLNGLSFLFNSYLPVVFGHDLGKPCLFVVLELFRMSAFISSVLHLLALASIHYNGTVRPLHYRVRACCSHHVTRSIHFISSICWLIPLILFCIYFSSIPCQGFQSPICDYSFFATKRYRYFYLALFLLPLIFMLILYVKIFFFIRQNQLIRHKTAKISNASLPRVNLSSIPASLDKSAEDDIQLNYRNHPYPSSLRQRAILIGVQAGKKMSISTSLSTNNNLPVKSVLILRNIRRGSVSWIFRA